jgi:hippurate hydrolase
MLNARPGAFTFIGNGESHGLHHPRCNFNDDAIPYGVRLVEQHPMLRKACRIMIPHMPRLPPK